MEAIYFNKKNTNFKQTPRLNKIGFNDGLCPVLTTENEMPKAKITITIQVEYEQIPEFYPQNSTAEQMLAIDLEGANSDPYLTMDNENAKWTITGETIDA